MRVRKALLRDAGHIQRLVNSLSGDGTLLLRSFAEVCENIRDFTIAEMEDGQFLGCGALHLYGPHLAEVRSIAVLPGVKGKGAGRQLLFSLLEEAEQHEVGCVCLFTRIPEYFVRFGFYSVEDRAALPDKIYKDCQNCPRITCCDEVAMARGVIPDTSILGPREPVEQLVKLAH